MATLGSDSEETRKKQRKLPPLSPRRAPKDGEETTNPQRKKKRRPLPESNGDNMTKSDTESSPRRRRASDNTNLADDEIKKVTRVKKKRSTSVPPASDDHSPPRTPKSPRRKVKSDVTGSKASLLSKESEPTTSPKTKKRRKVRKKTPQTDEQNEYTDPGLAADLNSIIDDVIKPGDTKEDKEGQLPQSTSVTQLRSQPLGKLFIETDSGFKGQNKLTIARRQAEEEDIKDQEEPELPRQTSIEFGLRTYRFIRTVSLFCHGLAAGFAIWHIVMTYVLSSFGNEDFLQHYGVLGLPVQSIFYVLLVICTVSACDRHDVGKPTGRWLLRAITMQSGAISILIYFSAIILSVSIASVEDRISLYTSKPELWADQAVADSELSTWRAVNVARGVLVVLGWLVLSLTPNTDRLTENLKQADDDILGTPVEHISKA